MRTRTAASCALALALASGAGARTMAEADKANEVMAAARKAIGDRALDGLKTLSLEASVQRNVNTMQLTSEIEILLDLPDRYLRSDAMTGPMSGSFTTGFNGDKTIRSAGGGPMAGGGIVIRMGGPDGPMPAGERPTPEEQERLDRQLLRNHRVELSRLMLGWFGAAHPAVKARFAYAGEAESPDGKADVIDATDADGFSARLFIDRETHLPLMVTYRGPQPRIITAGGPPPGPARSAPHGERREPNEEERRRAREAVEKQMQEMRSQPPALADFTLFFDDWREVGGIRFPHKLRRASAGATNEEWTINKVKVNPKIDPKKFDG